MHKKAIIAASASLAILMLAVGLSVAYLATLRSVENICDGKPHRIGDIEIQFTKISVTDDKFEIEVVTKNVSVGSVLQPTQAFDLFDEFNNPIHTGNPPGEYIQAGKSENAKYAGFLPAPNASAFRVSMRMCMGRDQSGELTKTVTGSFKR